MWLAGPGPPLRRTSLGGGYVTSWRCSLPSARWPSECLPEPGTEGEELTGEYLISQFKALGLKPGNPDGTYVQKVPLVGITGSEAQPLTIAKGIETR